MVRRFVFGVPIETEAVLCKPDPQSWQDLPDMTITVRPAVKRPAGAGAFWEAAKEEPKAPAKTAVQKKECGGESGETKRPVRKIPDEEAVLSLPLEKGEIVYGLGEQVRGMNKRGWLYVSDCTDEPHHQEDTHSLYGAHNFLLLSGERQRGIFLDTPAKVTFDIGYTDTDRLEITVEGGAFDLYLIYGETPDDVVYAFRELIGPSYLPPKWAFGFGQSRWGYRTSEDVRKVAKQYRDNRLPLDMIYLDIDYMDHYKDFTINRETFPDFEELVEEMRAQHIRLIPIIDAGVKAEEGYEVCVEGLERGYFCKDENGEPFAVGVWPGLCYFPDMLNEDARRWFGRKYEVLLEKGIEGFWNDMNEPALFYSERRLKQVLAKIQGYKEEDLSVQTAFEFQNLIMTLAKNPEDYRSFYHDYKGELVRHDQVHNLFGFHMTRSAAEAFEELRPDKRTLLFSRASYIGMHRYAGIWMGDNRSWWSHLLMNLKMAPSLNMCGFLYTGADIGGFGADCTRDLLLRWMALGIFLPLFRNHSAAGTRTQEPYAFGDVDAFRGILSLRYRLLPYLYSEFMKAALRGKMYARPLGFVWTKDTVARQTEDELLIGESILIAPVYEQNAGGRIVYLPEPMKLVRFAGDRIAEEKELPAGHHYVSIPLEEVVLFIRKGYILPLADSAQCVEEVDWEHLTLCHYAEAGAVYELYDDDGTSPEVSLEGHVKHLILPA